MRIQPTNIMKLSLWMLLTKQFVMTLGSTGSARVSTSTVSFAVLLQLARSTGVSEGEVICTTRRGHLAEQPGRETRLFASAGTAKMVFLLKCLDGGFSDGCKGGSCQRHFCTLKPLHSELLELAMLISVLNKMLFDLRKQTTMVWVWKFHNLQISFYIMHTLYNCGCYSDGLKIWYF